MVWIVCHDSDNKVFYENFDTREMKRKIPRELMEVEEKKEKELLEEYQRLTNEIGRMWENMNKSQQTIENEKSKCIQIQHDITKLYEQLKTLDLLWKPNGRIEELPAEILFHIFKQLFDLKSVSNCYNTNLRWKKIVEDVLKNSRSKFVNIQSDKQFPLQMFNMRRNYDTIFSLKWIPEICPFFGQNMLA